VLVSAMVREQVEENPILGQMIGGRVAVFDILSTSGGFGSVYLGVQQPLGREVVVKLIRPYIAALPGMRDRFLHEARMLQEIRAPEIVTVHDVLETDDGALCIVMERVPGRTLEAMLEEDGLGTLLMAIDVTIGTLSALSVAHSHGLVHRDLKPSNIMVGQGGEVTLIDFGVAKQVAAKGGVEQGPQTRTGMALGTPRYMAPEQVRSKGVVSARTDLYACGILLYELLAGHTPFDGSEGEMLAAHLGATPPPFSVELAIHPGLEQVVMRALAKDPSRRYDSADEMREALVACRSAIVASGSPMVSRATPTKIDVKAETVAAGSGGVLTTDINWVVESRRKQAQTPLALIGLGLVGIVVWAVMAEDGRGPAVPPTAVSRPAVSPVGAVPAVAVQGDPVVATSKTTTPEAGMKKASPHDAAMPSANKEADAPAAVRKVADVKGRASSPIKGLKKRAVKPSKAAVPPRQKKRAALVTPAAAAKGPGVTVKPTVPDGLSTSSPVKVAAVPSPLVRDLEAALRRCRCGTARTLLKKLAPHPRLTKEWSPRVDRCRPPLPDFGCRYTP